MPTSRYKVMIIEVDGADLEYPEELALDADKVFFTDAAYISDNVQAAIVETLSLSGSSRRPYQFVYDSVANSGRWLERSKWGMDGVNRR